MNRVRRASTVGAFVALLAFVAMPVFAVELPPKEALLFAQLRGRIETVEQRLDGVLGVSVKDLKTGATIEIRPDEIFPTASSIKAAVLYELYRQAEEGTIDLGELTRPPVPRVGGGGVLEHLGDRARLTWRDLAVLMFAFSDNEATNVLTRRLGMASINHRLDTLGLEQVRMRRLMMDLDAARRGDENLASPAGLRRLMEIVYEGKGLSRERARDMMQVATVEKWGTAHEAASPFRSALPADLRVADKPGSLEGVRCVAAVVDLPGRPYSVTLMITYLRDETDGEAAIREISRALYETFDRLARASEHGRVISPRNSPDAPRPAPAAPR